MKSFFAEKLFGKKVSTRKKEKEREREGESEREGEKGRKNTSTRVFFRGQKSHTLLLAVGNVTRLGSRSRL